MKFRSTHLALALVLIAAPARAAVTFDYLFDEGQPLGTSADGTVLTGGLFGNNNYFRWTQATGPVALGRPQHNGAGGLSAISLDGTRIAGSIARVDSSYTTQGLWTLGSGWQELMPPTPPDGGSIDGSFGNVFGMSGDGGTVVGLYWRSGVGNRAHASKWTPAGGVVDLGGTVTGQSSRANGANYDGSVIAGWVETPTGPWRPAAWVNGTTVLLTSYVGGGGEARVVSPNGLSIAGFAADSVSGQRGVTRWTRTANGAFGPPEYLGVVDGTTAGSGENVPFGISSDGKIIIGYCTFEGDPFYTTGFIYTEATGVVDINAFLADNGVFVDPNFTITTLSAMTPDGTQIFGYGQMLTAPYTHKVFRITVPRTVSVPQATQRASLELSAPRPNPTSGASRLDFTIARASTGDLSIFDATGRRIATLAHGDFPAGRQSAAWDGRDASGQMVSAGLYFARLATPDGSISRRIARVN